MNELTQTNTNHDMNISDMTQLAKAVAASKLFGMQTPEQALVLLRNENKEGAQPDYEIFISDGQDRPQAQGTEYADEEAPF